MNTLTTVDATKFRQVMEKWKITVVTFDEKLYVRARDIGEKLKITNVHMKLDSKGELEKRKIAIKTKGGPQLVTFVSIIGVQRLVCSSRKSSSIMMCKDLGLQCQLKLCPIETTYVYYIMKAFDGEEIIEQYNVDNYRLDLYFPKFNIAVEIDEDSHANSSNRKKDLRRHNYILNKLNCRMIRVCQDDCPFETINMIYKSISSCRQQSIITQPIHQLEMKNEPETVQSEKENPKPKSVLPLPELPQTIDDMKQFYGMWQSTMKAAYESHYNTHGRYKWKEIFGANRKVMCQRFTYLKHFLQFVDNLKEGERDRFFEVVYTFCNTHKLAHTSFIKVVWRGVCIEDSALQDTYTGLDTKLREFLQKHNFTVTTKQKQKRPDGTEQSARQSKYDFLGRPV
ncbi:hypothetical protein EB118_13475 [bacterium]|nr:hypothetical protein [bacterium]NDC94600.1 hypothetical protein [bacterium]NDD84826.1 hypothetical protein [bacterium]NDG31063.1 hypothetical protein [bacterium]